jgi:hypothetical protein
LSNALAVLRPYRGGAKSEDLKSLFERIKRQIGAAAINQLSDDDEEDWLEEVWKPDGLQLDQLIKEGIALIKSDASQVKWDAICKIIDDAEGEKIVLFAQPVETVTVVADMLERRYGHRPAMIIGNQRDDERTAAVASFQSDDGPRFLVSSKAGGEGLNMQKARRLIHLDVPWNPMDLEQRIGRVHRFGSRKTVVIDTVVAAGSREIDMYRIAREKLLMISKHLDPDQFETLFSRVMSLVPPKELEGILSDIGSSDQMDSYSTQEIGRLVTAGFQSWSEFDSAYRNQADEIRAANPGQARWADLGAFLVRFGGAKDGGTATFSSFNFSEEEIVAVEESIPTIEFGNERHVCGDTGGLIALNADGTQAKPLGLNIPAVQSVLKSAFAPTGQVGPAFVKLASKENFLGFEQNTHSIIFFLRQSVVQKAGLWSERALSLHAEVVSFSGEQRSLNSPEIAAIVRQLSAATRIREPIGVQINPNLQAIEKNLVQDLRRPTDDEIASGIRFVVWPIATVISVR